MSQADFKTMKYKTMKQSKEEETIQQIPAKTIIWGEIADKKMSWGEAKKWCEEQGGRLPTHIELLEAFKTKIKGFKSGNYWSSTEFDSVGAWDVDFDFGYVGNDNKNDDYYVRCVRDK